MASSISSYSLGLLRMASESAARADAAAKAKPDIPTDEALTTIILAVAAAEAFVNDLSGVVLFASKATGVASNLSGQRLIAVCEAINLLENENCQIRSKYLLAAMLLDCQAIRRDREPYQSFNDLVTLRNGIVHGGPVTSDERGGPVRVADTLAQRGIARKAKASVDTWWVRIQTPAAALWAVDVAKAIMLAVVRAAVAIHDPENTLSKYYVTYLETL